MSGFIADCHHALRIYIRTPLASAIAISILAIAIAFVGAFLSLYVDLVLRPHPGFEQSGRIATAGIVQPSDGWIVGVPYEALDRMADEMTTIEAAAMATSASTLVGANEQSTDTGLVSKQFFPGLRPRMALGRGFELEDHVPGAEPVAVLSNAYWKQRFNGDRGVIDGYLEISRDPANVYVGLDRTKPAEPAQSYARFRIIGVLKEPLPTLPNASFEPAIWLPIEVAYPMFVADSAVLLRAISPALVRRVASASDTAIAEELTVRYSGPDSFVPGLSVRFDAVDGIVSNAVVQRDAKRQLEAFLFGSVLLALVAAANVSLFLLARAPGRRRELGIRLAVGAPIGRITRQLATEGALLVVAAAVLGLMGSAWLSFALRGLDLLRAAEWDDVTLFDWRVLGLMCLVLFVLILLVSLTPLLSVRQHGIGASSRFARSRASLAQRCAGTVQLAVAGAFAGAAIAFVSYLSPLVFGDPGFEVPNRFLVQTRYQNFGASREALALEPIRWRESVEAIPGVTAVGYGRPVPGNTQLVSSVTIPNPADPAERIEIQVGEIERRFIDILGLRLLHGTAPESNERVLVVNRTLARAIWGRDDVVGEYLSGNVHFNSEGGGGTPIVGVIDDISFGHPAAPPKPFAFRGFANQLSSVIHAELSAAQLEQALRRLTPSELDVQVTEVRSLQSIRNELLSEDYARAFSTVASAILVIVLTAFGFYGTQRYLVTDGMREYAIRFALGSGPKLLGRLVLLRGMSLGAPGLVLGLLFAVISVSWLRDEYLARAVSFGAVSVAVLLALIGLVLLASLGPANQAKRLQPAAMLRED